MRPVCRNIFKEYNIPRDVPKKGKRAGRQTGKTTMRLNTTSTTEPYEPIECFSEDENLSPRKHSFVQLRRSFEIPLTLTKVRRNLQNFSSSTPKQQPQVEVCNNVPRWIRGGEIMSTPPDEDSDDDGLMPRPIVIKQEPLTQPSEEIQLSLPCSSSSIVSSINSITPRLRTKMSSDESSLESDGEDGSQNSIRRKKSSLRLSGLSSSKRSRKEILSRYRPLDISINKISSPKKRSTPRKRKTITGSKRRTRSQTSKAINNDLNISDEEPFNSLPNDRSFDCSSPIKSQVISTPSGTPSPRKRPTELDLMIELIEKENAAKNNSPKKSPRKSSKKCLPGGYVELYRRSLTKAKTDARYFKHDKKFGLRIGTVLRVLKLESQHNVHFARVQIDDESIEDQQQCSNTDEVFYIVLPHEMVSHIKLNSKIEAFFDESSQPYHLQTKNGTAAKVYVKPYKLLLL